MIETPVSFENAGVSSFLSFSPGPTLGEFEDEELDELLRDELSEEDPSDPEEEEKECDSIDEDGRERVPAWLLSLLRFFSPYQIFWCSLWRGIPFQKHYETSGNENGIA